MDEVIRALADPTRRHLLDALNEHDGQTLGQLCAGLSMSRQAASKHLAVLESAGLVSVVWRGREKWHYLNAVPITALADRWITRYDRARARALVDLKTALEARPMDQPSFVYATHIRTTPEKLWAALTEPEFTRRYWGVALTSEWTEGATITWEIDGMVIADDEQVVLTVDPPRRLSYTWHTMTEEFTDHFGFDHAEELRAEARSTVTFEIEPHGEVVLLRVIHDGFPERSRIREMIQEGWPAILSSLKTLLETGDPLPAP